ncbi:MAG: sulfite exporter TauE/SafE family protein [Polyangiales bacterium]
MDSGPSRWLLLALSAFAAGAVNSVAGGGSLLTFPALLAAGLDPLAANATSTVALVPGSISACVSYREHLRGQSRAVLVMALPSLVGGVLGAVLLLRGGSERFTSVVPWLLLGATGLFASQEFLARWRARRAEGEQAPESDPALDRPSVIAALSLGQLLVATYGGYFGAGIGIAMLAALSLTGMREIHRMNALKNLSAALINGVAVVLFVQARAADLRIAAVMAVAAILGGRSGARLAQRVRPESVRRLVTLIGLAITVMLFARRFLR